MVVRASSLWPWTFFARLHDVANVTSASGEWSAKVSRGVYVGRLGVECGEWRRASCGSIYANSLMLIDVMSEETDVVFVMEMLRVLRLRCVGGLVALLILHVSIRLDWTLRTLLFRRSLEPQGPSRAVPRYKRVRS